MKKVALSFACLFLIFCSCNRVVGDDKSYWNKMEDCVILEKNMSDKYNTQLSFLKKYEEIVEQKNVKRQALIYLDQDEIPELVILKDGKYELYTIDGSEVAEIKLPTDYMNANAYGFRQTSGDTNEMAFFQYEYVPYEGLIRVHNGDSMERTDYYLRYEDRTLKMELMTKSVNRMWLTYDAKGEISNENFLNQRLVLGYDQLIPCTHLYESIADAYNNINNTSDTEQLFKSFENGEINCVDHVEKSDDIPENVFVNRSYMDYVTDITDGEEWWLDTEYIDFDNDGEEELILHGYAGDSIFFDAVGDAIYKVLQTGGTSDMTYVSEFDGKRVIARTDLFHSGRKHYEILQFDSCCELVDRFQLDVEYRGDKYTKEDSFKYRNHPVTMEEYEAIVNKIQ